MSTVRSKTIRIVKIWENITENLKKDLYVFRYWNMLTSL